MCLMSTFANAAQTDARFFRDASGATAIEYGLIAVGISVILVVNALGTQLQVTFNAVTSNPPSAGNPRGSEHRVGAPLAEMKAL
jgi:pilus assembly protein Flp/PilA